MKLQKALLVVMRRWNLTGYRLSQVSGIQCSALSKIIRGDQETANWDLVQKIAEGLERIEPMAKACFFWALESPDNTYPDLTDDLIDFALLRESPDDVALVMEALGQCKLLNQRNLKSVKEKIASDPKNWMGLGIEHYIAAEMVRIRREREPLEESDE
jgi:hypothetical protein